MKVIETMGGVDILTRDIADMRNGLEFVNHTPRHVSPFDYPISGDEIARMRAEAGDDGGTDCGA